MDADKSKITISSIQESAQQFSAKGEYDKAIAAWKKILTVRQDPNIYNTVGDLYIKKGSQNEAIEFFMLSANKFRSDGFHQKAIAIYKKILNIVPFDINALISFADVYAERGFAGNAVTYYTKAAEKLSRDGDIDKAIDIYNKILLLTPSDLNIKTRIADLWLSRGLPEKAANSYAGIAAEYMGNDDLDMAIEYFAKAIGSDPHNVPSYVGLSNLAEKKDNLEQALNFAEKALHASHNDKDILSKYVQLAIRADRTQDAKDILTKLLVSGPADIYFQKLLGSIYINEGSPDKAWEELQPYIDELLQDQNWDDAYELLDLFKATASTLIKQRLATVYRGKNDNESLAEELNDLAKIYEGQGAYRNALVLYREIAELQPDSISIRNKIEELELSLESKTPPVHEKSSPEKTKISLQGQTDDAFQEDLVNMRTEAEFFANQGLIEEAVSIYEKIIAVDPDNKKILDQIQTLRSLLKAGPAALVNPASEEISVQPEDDTFPDNINYSDTEEDFESHYTAGIEYKQNGMLDEAIREFQIVARDPEKTLLSSKMIALCFMEKGVFIRAIEELNMLLESMPDDDERRLDIKYELAGAHMKNDDYDIALEIYSEILSISPDYKDVPNKITILKYLNES